MELVELVGLGDTLDFGGFYIPGRRQFEIQGMGPKLGHEMSSTAHAIPYELTALRTPSEKLHVGTLDCAPKRNVLSAKVRSKFIMGGCFELVDMISQ